MADKQIHRIRRKSDGTVTEVLPRFFPRFVNDPDYEAWIDEVSDEKPEPKTIEAPKPKAGKSTRKPKTDE